MKIETADHAADHIRRILEIQHAALMVGKLSMWTIYDHPKDFPHSYVARRFEVGSGHPNPLATEDIVQGELHMLRESFLIAGLTCLERNVGDDMNIVETWL